MGRVKYHCAYCDRSFDDSQDARKRHFSGRNHRANVKLWYDSFADQEAKATRDTSEWTVNTAQGGETASSMTASKPLAALPPSMVPAPPEAFRRRSRLAEWG